MSEYWKSIPKKWCDFCKCYITNNKLSVESHELGLRHKGNVERKLNELTRRGSVQKKEEDSLQQELAKIEAAALSSFAKDVARDPSHAKELSNATKLSESSSSSSLARGSNDRFGESSEDSANLIRARERALDSVTKNLEKRSKWFESKTSEGKSFYWNKETYETVWEPPKFGFLSLDEQESMGPEEFRPKFAGPLGGWKETQQAARLNTDSSGRSVDLQLPSWTNKKGISTIINVDSLPLPSFKTDDEGEINLEDRKILFSEKTLDTVKPSTSKPVNVEFKKRKIPTDTKRNVRQRSDN